MRFIILLLLIGWAGLVFAAPTNLSYGDPSWTFDASFPEVIYDDDYEGWKFALWLGNFATKTLWHDGPRLEAGGMKRPSRAVQGNGKVYLSFAPYNQTRKLIEVDETTGVARLFMDRHGVYTGPTEDVIAGQPLYDAVNDILYLTDHFCLRKVVDDGDGTRSVELVAGQCGVEGAGDATDDGTEAGALFGISYGWAVAQDGNIYRLERDTVKKVTPAGVVTTFTVTRPDDADPPWNSVGVGAGLLSNGENANTLYISDGYGAAGNSLWKLDLTTNAMSHVAGVLKADDTYDRHGLEVDGPATTLAAARGGFYGRYNPFYDRIITRGQDNLYLHKLAADGWLKTMLFAHRPGDPYPTWSAGMIHSGNYYNPSWAYLRRLTGVQHIAAYAGHDDRGGIYVWHAVELSTFWRAYNSLKGGTE